MDQIDLKDSSNNSGEITIKEIGDKFKSTIRYFKSKQLIIYSLFIIGGVLGIVYAFKSKTKYTAVTTFVLEDGKSGLGQYSGIAAVFGVSLGGGGGGGVFQGDNILELYKSRSMIEKTLLSEAVFNGKKQLLIDRYASTNNLRARWKKADRIDSITFVGDPAHFSRKQDSIITNIVETINKGELDVAKPDKKLNIIKVSFTTTDELFTKEFTNRLVQTVNDFYVQTKTKKASQNLSILSGQADSVKRVLNSSIGGVASAIDAAPNANPLQLTLKVASQRKQIDVQASSAVYVEIVKNIETSKLMLRQEVPLIQVIDNPVLPLEKHKIGKIKAFLIGSILGTFLSIVLLILLRVYQKLV